MTNDDDDDDARAGRETPSHKTTSGRMTTSREDVETNAMAIAASTATFTSLAWTTQRLGMVLRIACGTPFVSGIAASMAIASSAALSGASARVVERARAARKRGKGGTMKWVTDALVGGADARDVARDVFVGGGVFLFLSRGNLSRIFASDVARVGANARKSVAAKGSEYATDAQRRLLGTWLKKHGCHHCGSTRGSVIGDHMPPNKKAFGSGAAAKANRGASFPRRVFNYLRGVPLQRFYPQCEPCSALQSVAVRTGSRTFVAHRVGLKYGVLCGVACGIAALHFDDIRDWIDDNARRARKTFASRK